MPNDIPSYVQNLANVLHANVMGADNLVWDETVVVPSEVREFTNE
jgi:hypothetical protein